MATVPVRTLGRHVRAGRLRHGALPTLWGALALAVAWTSPAVAQDGPPAGGDPALSAGLEPSIAVIELYMAGTNYEKTPYYALRVADELMNIGGFAMLARDDAERQIRALLSTSSRRVTDEKLAEIEQMLAEGDKLVYTNPRKAIEILDRAKAELQAIMESISLNQKLRKDFFTTQMLLARSHHDNGNRAKASEIMDEIIRVFGEEEKVTEENYHPDIVALYRESYRRMGEQRTGSLKVTTEPPGAEILINGKVQDKPSPATFEGLYPGTVTVAARKDGRESLIHKMQIVLDAPGETSIDIDYETSVAFDDKRFGFVFPDQATLEKRVADFASRVGRMLKVDYILVTGLVDKEGRTFLDGHLVSVADEVVERSNAFYTKANVVSNNRVREMAAFIGAQEYVAPPPSFAPWYTNWLGWVLVGAGVASAGAGAGLLVDFQGKADDFETDWTTPFDPADRPGRINYQQGTQVTCQSWRVDPRDSDGSTNPHYQARCASLINKAERANTSSQIGTALLATGGALVIGGALVFAFWKIEAEDADVAEVYREGGIELEYAMPSFSPRGDVSMGLGFSF